MKLIIHFIVCSLLVSPTSAHFCHWAFNFGGRNCVNADLKEQCERKIGFLSDTVSFFSTIASPTIPLLGLGTFTGVTATVLVEKTNWFVTSGLLGQFCNKFDDGAEHTIDELDYIEFGETRLKINDVKEDFERFKSILTQQEQVVNAKVEARLAQFEAKLAQSDAKFAQIETKLAQTEAKLVHVEAKLAQIQTSIDKPHIVKTPEFPENSQFTKFSVQSDGEKSLESQPKMILKSSQTHPRIISLQKRPRSRQRPLAKQHQLASLRPNMERFKEMKIGRFSRSVPRKSRKIFSKPPKFPRKKPMLLKGKTFSIPNIRGVFPFKSIGFFLGNFVGLSMEV